jgi:predicted DNA-binding transcriptional regulator AlpA
MSKKYIPGNRYSERVSLIDAATDWQGLTQLQLDRVFVGDDGLPTHLGFPDLRERAEGLLIAIQHGLIKGYVHNENGDYIHPEHMKLDRESVAAWIKKTDTRLELDKPIPAIDIDATSIGVLERLLDKDEVCTAVKVSKATIDRWRSLGKFPQPTHEHPNRWLASVVAAHIASTAIQTARGDLTNPSTDEEDI